MIYLLVKQHNITGLKYLHKTTLEDHSKYHGSGKDWIPHLEEYGYDYSSTCIFQTEDKKTFKNMGIYFSELWNIVESDEWANRTREEGQGGNTGPKKGKRGPQKNPRLSRGLSPKKGKSYGSQKKPSGPRGPQKNPRKPMDEVGKAARSGKRPPYPLLECPICRKIGISSNMKRWHGINGEKCKASELLCN
jgi:hypothetical protein